MTIDFMEFLKETFENEDNLDFEQVKKLALEAKAFLDRLEESLERGTPQQKAAAAADALEIKEFLDYKAKTLAERTGFNLQEFQGNPPKLTEKEQEAVTDISNNLDSINKIKPKIKKLKPIYLR